MNGSQTFACGPERGQLILSDFIKPLENNNAIERLRGYVIELAVSFTGRVDVDNYNTFLQESVELLQNAITLFYEGYFDASYYSLRSATEVSTVGVSFSDAKDGKRRSSRRAWIKREYFPTQRKPLKRLAKDGSVFSELHEKMPAFLELLSSTERLNKTVHKQGYDSFYCIRNHPLHRMKHSQEEFINSFIQDLHNAIGVVSVMGLAIDPFPVLLADPERINRYADSVTRPFFWRNDR